MIIKSAPDKFYLAYDTSINGSFTYPELIFEEKLIKTYEAAGCKVVGPYVLEETENDNN